MYPKRLAPNPAEVTSCTPGTARKAGTNCIATARAARACDMPGQCEPHNPPPH
ncbi:hypothetical protein GT370_18885 [Acidocella sp. MX-AZ03]|uniref:hypothetical protein n=1 Tax=Acidocella sp. MX-AZ03 TaxID=2697363 RepID=UPI0022DE29BE|nr:hypothetical protein [Acidocella sp. MX-AZ03]WBO59102.1 hypothetical protein GT370_18885 [Acidocella sp. MX-AZ03]